MPFEPPDERNSRTTKRNRFLAEIRNSKPEVLETLRDEVYPVFCRTISNLDPTDVTEEIASSDLTAIDNRNEFQRKTKQLIQALDAWCKKWNLIDEWLRKVAIRTLIRWGEHNVALENLDWSKESASFWMPQFNKKPIALEILVWNPIGFQTTKEYKAKALAEVEAAINERLSEIVDVFTANGWKEERRAPKEEHFSWLVEYQIGGLGEYRIAKKQMKANSTGAIDSVAFHQEKEKIKIAVKRLATGIGLTTRPQIRRGTIKS